MMLSRSFALKEFTVSGSHPRLVKPIPVAFRHNAERLAREVLQPIRDALGEPIRVTSGYRDPVLNKAVGGSPTSQHLIAEAADWTAPWLGDVFESLLMGSSLDFGQCIYYPMNRFIHIALPSGKYPRRMFFVHAPKAGLSYRRVQTMAAFKQAMLQVPR